MESPEDAPNIYQRYVNAAQKQLMQGKKKTEQIVGDKKVNIAMTKHDSIFPSVHLPGGISTKATEYKELGMSGEKWESPVFKLGSASTSTDIAHAPRVSRKQHTVTQGGIRESPDVGGDSSRPVAAGGPNSGAVVAGPDTSSQAAGGTTGNSAPDTSIPATATTATTADTHASPGQTLLGNQNPVLTGDA